MEKVSPTPPIIHIRDVSYIYYPDNVVLKEINLDIHEGEFLGLIGPNGGGKSTLLKLIMGILPLQKGSIKLFNIPLQSFTRWNLIGYVSQRATNFDRRFPATVEEVVTMGRISRRGLFKNITKEDRQQVKQALQDVEMWESRSLPLAQLSGGQQQRVFIARALASNPKLLVLDEPTVGIDIKAQEQFYQLLQKLRFEKNLTIILVSHDIDVVATQATSFACVNQHLIYHGEPQEFIKQDYLEKLYGKDLRFILHGH